MKIGIAITTTPNRASTHAEQMLEIAKFTPKSVLIFVHNDKDGIGIARSKNNCLKALYEAGCDHLFLLDDDVWPVKKGWLDFFVKSGLNHACPTFTTFNNGGATGHSLLKTVDGVDYFSRACGMVLYYTRACISRVGGFDVSYGRYGYEHTGFSVRIRNAGLTKSAFLSPVGSMEYFRSLDYERGVESSVTSDDKWRSQKYNKPIFDQEMRVADWKPFKKGDYVLTAYYTRNKDEQRGNKTAVADLSVLDTLVNSSPCEVVLFSDMGFNPAFKGHQIFSVVKQGISVYNYRFMEWYQWLVKNREYCNVVYLLDATDTEFIGEPHEIEPGKVYMNTEGKNGGLGWLVQKSSYLRIKGRSFLMARGNDIWNCGVIYGHVDAVIKLLEAIQPHLRYPYLMDMPSINYVANMGVPGVKFVPVKSGFKSDDKSGVYIRHK
jgi:hypothetical protein